MDAWLREVLTFLLCVIAAGVVSSIETALLGIPMPRLRMAMERREAAALRFDFWLERSGCVLLTLNFVRMCLVIGASIAAIRATDALQSHVGRYDWLTALIAGILVLLLGHVIPRGFAKRWPYEWAHATMGIVRVLTLCLTPIIWPFQKLSYFIARLTGQKPSTPFWTPEELEQRSTAARAAALGQPNEDLLKSIIEFSDTVIREIMVPRTAMIAVAVNSTSEEVLEAVMDAGHSRIPVYEDTIDNIIGLLHVRELFAAVLQLRSTSGANAELQVDLRTLLRPTFYVPEVMQISELLREFQRRKTHLAIAVDEYGGTAGVVTLEDIIEEIVGEIQDEYDVDEKQYRSLGENKIIADARAHIWDLEKPLNVVFPDDGGYETLAGFIMTQLGYIPESGTVLNWKNLRFTIKEANEKRIGMVEIERRPKGESGLSAPRRE